MTGLLSGRVVTTPNTELDSTRKEFLELSQAEPNLGDPTVTGLLLTSTLDGTRSWVSMNDLGVQLNSNNIIFDTPLTSPTTSAQANPDTISQAVSIIDSLMSLLRPKPPLTFPQEALTVTSVGANSLLASGPVPNNSADTPTITAGQPVVRVTGSSISSNQLGTGDNEGPGNSGTVTALVNGAGDGAALLSATSPSGTYGSLVISDVQDYPSSIPGFWKSFRCQIVDATVAPGFNSFQITDSAAGNTNKLWFVDDNLTDRPVLFSGTIQTGSFSSESSSGVTHYGSGSTLQVLSLQLSNIAGETYSADAPVSTTVSNGIGSTALQSYAAVGIATPVARQTLSPVTLSTFSVALDGVNIHNQGQMTVTGHNVNGDSSPRQFPTRILVMLGDHANRVAEQNIPGMVSTGVRTYLGPTATGDHPSLTLPSTAPVWDSTQDLSQPGYLHEAGVVAGALSCDQNNYSTNYLPANSVNYSSKPATQYMSFVVTQTAVSSFFLNITGTYSEILVGLPGISDNAAISPNAIGGTWWTANQLYSGAGVPGRAGDNVVGCAVGTPALGGTGSVKITFGPQSSTNATNNRIIVRIKLTAGQAITSMSISN